MDEVGLFGIDFVECPCDIESSGETEAVCVRWAGDLDDLWGTNPLSQLLPPNALDGRGGSCIPGDRNDVGDLYGGSGERWPSDSMPLDAEGFPIAFEYLWEGSMETANSEDVTYGC